MKPRRAAHNRRDLSWTTPWQAVRLILVGATAPVAWKVALVVGSILSVVNQAGVVVAGGATLVTGVRVFVNYLVPYTVCSVGYLASFRVERE